MAVVSLHCILVLPIAKALLKINHLANVPNKYIDFGSRPCSRNSNVNLVNIRVLKSFRLL